MTARRVAFSLGLAAMLVSLGATGLSAPVRAQPGLPPADPPSRPTPIAFHCEPYATHTVCPAMALLGEAREVTTTIRVESACRGGTYPFHAAIVLTGMNSGRGSTTTDLLEGLLLLVEAMFRGDGPSVRVGVVVADERSARIAQALTGDKDAVSRAIRRWYAIERRDQGAVDDALSLTRVALDRALTLMTPDDLPGPREVAILVGDLGGQDRCPTPERSAERMKRSGVLIMTACKGRDCITRCHTALARSARYVYDGTWNWLFAAFEPVRDGLTLGGRTPGHLSKLEVETVLGPSVEYVEGSADPALTLRDGVRLGWSTRSIPQAGVTFTYSVRIPMEAPGAISIAESSTVSAWSPWNHVSKRSVPTPRVLILEPREWPFVDPARPSFRPGR